MLFAMDSAQLFRSVPARLLVVDPSPDFVVAEASDAWLRSRRTDRPSVVGRSLFEVLEQGPESARIRVALGRVLASRRGDEENSPVFSPDGTIACIVHREAASETELLTSLEERDRALRELRSVRQELEAFAQAAARDLHAPLRALTGYCALLRNLERGMLPPTAYDLIGRMDTGIREMTGIIEGLIEFTRVDTSRLMPRRVNLSALARRIARDLQERHPERRASVEIADWLVATADEDLVEIALQNLLGNAWKYTSRRGDARIEVGQRQVVGRDVFYVSDNGVGFDMARADRLFTPFFRMHPEFEGHGMGLAAVRRAVERHGGEIWAESHPGRGTTINFTLGAR
jgi:signal transduction histidine kinase